MTYIVYFFDDTEGVVRQWATIANSAKEARYKFTQHRGRAEQILYVRRLTKHETH